VVVGTASAVSHGVNRRMSERDMRKYEEQAAQQAQADAPQQLAETQAEMAAMQQQMAAMQAQQAAAYAPPPQAAPPPAASGTTDVIAQLERLGQLRDAGVLTEAEFAAQKAKLLNG
jgi:hypothetical protein